MLRVESLRKTMGAFSLCIDELRIDGPGVYGLMGANGCGKSTAAKLICGVAKPDGGSVRTGLSSREVTLVPRKPYIMNDTVYRNLAYPLKVRGIDPREKCEEYLGLIGFAERRREQARGLSGGEMQKLALARAMIFDPKLIILDEAMTDLDLDSLDMFMGMVLDRQRRDPAIWIVISHHLAQIRRLCGRVFFMSGGRIAAQGPTEELLRSEHPCVRRYMRSEGLG